MKRFLLVIFLIVLAAVLTEVIGLAILRYNRDAFAGYWQGRAKQSGEITYVALGDSAAQGLGASRSERGYVGLLADHLHQTSGKTVRVINLSVSGATLRDVLDQQIPQLNRYQPDIVTLDAGANDIVQHYDKATFEADFEALIQTLPPDKTVIANMPYFGPYNLYRNQTNPHAREANTAIAHIGQQYRMPVANLYETLAPHQSPLIYASDLFHPNDRGYRLWYAAFQPQTDRILSR
jgi:acyl-CoA thioesterase-1